MRNLRTPCVIEYWNTCQIRVLFLILTQFNIILFEVQRIFVVVTTYNIEFQIKLNQLKIAPTVKSIIDKPYIIESSKLFVITIITQLNTAHIVSLTQ